jgi:carbamoyl-phosphate synthase large subunit
MSMKRLKVLLTAVGSSTAISVMKSFQMQHEYDVEVFGTDTNVKEYISGSAFCDHYTTVPPASDEKDYIHSLLELIDENAIDLFIPIVDEELEVVAKYHRIIEKETFLLLSPYETIRTCNDKYLTFDAMKREGIPVVPTILPEDLSEISSLLEESGLTFPLIAKPRRGRGSKDIYRLDSPADLGIIGRIENPILQEYATGQEFVVIMFCNRDGPVDSMTRKTIALKGGVTYQCEYVEEPGLVDYSKKISQSMKFFGPVHIQWFLSDHGAALLEINPRFNGATCFDSFCGYNYPLYALRMADTGDTGLPGKPKHFRMCRYWNEIYYPLL